MVCHKLAYLSFDLTIYHHKFIIISSDEYNWVQKKKWEMSVTSRGGGGLGYAHIWTTKPSSDLFLSSP